MLARGYMCAWVSAPTRFEPQKVTGLRRAQRRAVGLGVALFFGLAWALWAR